MASGLTFHIPEEANPQTIVSILDAWMLLPGERFATSKHLTERLGAIRDIPQRSEAVSFAQRLGLIAREGDSLVLTALGRALAEQRDAVRFDLLHYLAYTAWNEHADAQLSPFWSYRSTCDVLWAWAPLPMDEESHRLVEHVVDAARSDFGDYTSFDAGRVSYSTKSVRAIEKWLQRLAPPVIDAATFRRRVACSSELVLLAIAYIYRKAGIEAGSEILLTGRNREIIASLCLVDLPYLERLIDWALARHHALVRSAVQRGAYGRAVRLGELPTVESILHREVRL